MISNPHSRNYAPRRNYPPTQDASMLLARLFFYTIFGACCFVIGQWAGEHRADCNDSTAAPSTTRSSK